MTLFTLEEAEAMLSQVREQLTAMQAAKRELDELREALGEVVHKAAGNGHVTREDRLGEQRQRAEALAATLNAGLERFQAWGVEIKGIDEGLVDFPSEREGRVVYLCWRLGEEGIGWWHELETGFAGRQPL